MRPLLLRNRTLVRAWRRAEPRRYWLSVMGLGVMGGGFVGLLRLPGGALDLGRDASDVGPALLPVGVIVVVQVLLLRRVRERCLRRYCRQLLEAGGRGGGLFCPTCGYPWRHAGGGGKGRGCPECGTARPREVGDFMR